MTAVRALLACTLLLGCTGRAAPILIGTAGPWKEGFGARTREGVEMAVAEINRRGGVRGRRLELVARDDDADGAKAVAIAKEFVETPRLVAVVGHVTSGAMVAAAKIYDGRLPAVATSATSPDLTGISPWTFRVISSDSTNGLDMARFAARLGRHRAAILYENDSYGRGLADAFRRSFAGAVVSIDPIAADMRNFEPYVAFYRERVPDLVFVAGTEQTGMALLREARREGLNADFLGGDGWTGVVDDPAAEGAYVGAPFTPADPRPEVQQFVRAFRAAYRVDPDGNAALGYDATMLVARAIERAGADRGKVRDWLAGLGSHGAFQGITGDIRFRPDGDPIGKSFVMTRVRRGALVVEGAGR